MLQPYLNFTGQCEEALQLYLRAFGGEIEYLVRYSDAPQGAFPQMDADQLRRVMHSQIRLQDVGTLSAADADWPVTQGSAVYLHVFLPSRARGEQVMAALAEGKELAFPLQPNPPPDDAGLSGMVTDRYGFTWVISAPNEK